MPDIWDQGVDPPKTVQTKYGNSLIKTQIKEKSLAKSKPKTHDSYKNQWRIPESRARAPNPSIFGNPQNEVETVLDAHLKVSRPVTEKGHYNHTAWAKTKLLNQTEKFMDWEKLARENSKSLSIGRKKYHKKNDYKNPDHTEVKRNKKYRPVSAVGHDITKTKQIAKNQGNDKYLIPVTKNNIRRDKANFSNPNYRLIDDEDRGIDLNFNQLDESSKKLYQTTKLIANNNSKTQEVQKNMDSFVNNFINTSANAFMKRLENNNNKNKEIMKKNLIEMDTKGENLDRYTQTLQEIKKEEDKVFKKNKRKNDLGVQKAVAIKEVVREKFKSVEKQEPPLRDLIDFNKLATLKTMIGLP